MRKKLFTALACTFALMMSACAAQTPAAPKAPDPGADAEVSYFDEISDYANFVTPGDYKNLTVTLPSINIDEAAVDAAVQNYALQMPGTVVTDRDVSMYGDQLLVDYSGRYKDDNTVFEGGTAQGQTVTIGGAGYIPGFSEGMEGKKVGEEFEMEVTFPEDYHVEDLKGREVIFTVTIHSISATPTLTDENVGELMNTHFGMSDINNMEDLRSYVRARLLEDAEAANESLLHDRVVEAAMEASTFVNDPPAKIVERYEQLIRSSVEQQAYMYQLYGYADMTTDFLLTQIAQQEGFEGTGEEFLHATAVDQVNSTMLFFAIAKAEEGVAPTEEEIRASVDQTLAQNGFTTEEEYETAAGYSLTPLVRETMTVDNVVAFLEEHVEITYE